MCDGVSNHPRHDCFSLFRHRSKKTSKLGVTCLCKGRAPVTGACSSQRVSNAEKISIWWRHHLKYHKEWKLQLIFFFIPSWLLILLVQHLKSLQFHKEKLLAIRKAENSFQRKITCHWNADIFSIFLHHLRSSRSQGCAGGTPLGNNIFITTRSNDRHGVSNYRSTEGSSQQCVQTNSEETSKVRVNVSLWGYSPHKGTVTRRMFPFDDVIINWTKCATLLYFIDISLNLSY